MNKITLEIKIDRASIAYDKPTAMTDALVKERDRIEAGAKAMGMVPRWELCQILEMNLYRDAANFMRDFYTYQIEVPLDTIPADMLGLDADTRRPLSLAADNVVDAEIIE